MVRIVLIGAGILTGVVSGYLVKRGFGRTCRPTLPSWLNMADLPIPRARSKKRPHPPDGEEADNGAICQAPESA